MKKNSLTWHKMAALKHARKCLVDNKVEYICVGLDDYYYKVRYKQDDTAKEAVKYLRQYIAKSLGAAKSSLYKGEYEEHLCLSDWLRDKEYISVFSEGSYKITKKKLRATRLAWIDWMIKCYEKPLLFYK